MFLRPNSPINLHDRLHAFLAFEAIMEDYYGEDIYTNEEHKKKARQTTHFLRTTIIDAVLAMLKYRNYPSLSFSATLDRTNYCSEPFNEKFIRMFHYNSLRVHEINQTYLNRTWEESKVRIYIHHDQERAMMNGIKHVFGTENKPVVTCSRHLADAQRRWLIKHWGAGKVKREAEKKHIL